MILRPCGGIVIVKSFAKVRCGQGKITQQKSRG